MVAQADLPFAKCVCASVDLADFKLLGPVGWYVLLVHTWKLGSLPVALGSHPGLVQTVETDSRARPALELDVESLGATRNCALLVRGA